jgi:hypothetical protein
MTTEAPQPARPESAAPPSPLRILARKNVLAGLMFIAIAAFGLFVSRHYPIGTALRMNTGYVPRLLLWMLLGLGVAILAPGLREKDAAALRGRHDEDETPAARPARWRSACMQIIPVVVVTGSLVAFALSVERLGLVLSILLLVGIGALAARDITAWEALAAAAVLIVLSWVIFIVGLGLTIPVWPDW